MSKLILSAYHLLFPVRFAHRMCGFAALPGSSLADVCQTLCSKLGLRDHPAGLPEPNFDNEPAPETADAVSRYREAVSRIKKNADRACSFQRFFLLRRISGALFATISQTGGNNYVHAHKQHRREVFFAQLSFLKESAYPHPSSFAPRTSSPGKSAHPACFDFFFFLKFVYKMLNLRYNLINNCSCKGAGPV